MLGKIELNVSGLVDLRRETTELLSTTRADIEADLDNRMSRIRVRQQEIIDGVSSSQRSLNLLRTRHNDLQTVFDSNKIITDDLVSRFNATRFIKNNVGLIPRLSANTNKDFIVTASHNANDAWKVFNSTTGYYWNSGVNVDAQGALLQPISIEIKLPSATRIHRIGLRTRSDTDKIRLWTFHGRNLG